MSSPLESASKACSSVLYRRKVHTTIMAASCARTPLRPLKLETRLHPPTPYSSAADWALLSLTTTTRDNCDALFAVPDGVESNPEACSCIRRVVGSPPPAASCYSAAWASMHFVCVYQRATLLDWLLRVHSSSIELDVSLSTSANTPAKDW